jgi:hypothetical protein
MQADGQGRLRWPAGFWERFIAEHWGRKPGAFRGIAEGAFGDTRAHLDNVVRARARCEAGEDVLRIYRGARMVGANANLPAQLFARSDDASVRGYVERLKRELESDDVSCVLARYDRSSERVWLAMTQLLHELFSRLGMAPIEADPAVFFGCYRKTSFGVHKDDGDVVTFVLEGRKRFLLWPYEYVAQKMGAVGCEHRTVAGYGGDFEAIRADAVVLEGEPGDMLYWPSTYWHVAETDGSFSFSLATRITVGGSLLPLVAEARRRLEGALNRTDVLDAGELPAEPAAGFVPCFTTSSLAAAAAPALARAQATLASPGFQDALAEVVVGAISALGLYPPMAPDAELAPFEAGALAGASLRLRALPIAVHPLDADTMFVAAHGHVLRVPSDPRLVTLIERLDAGSAIPLGELLEPFMRSPHIEVGGREFVASPDEVLALLETLTRYRALEVIAPAS